MVGKSILARIQSMKEYGFDETDGTKVNQVAKALGAIGVKLMDSNGQFRNFGKVMDEIGVKWKSLDSRQKAYIATTVAGTYQQSKFLNLMEGYGNATELYKNSLESAGTAQQKFNLYQQGTEAQLNKLKATWEGVWMSAFNSNDIKLIVGGLNSVAGTVKTIINQFGLLAPAIAVVSLGFIALNTKAKAALIALNTNIKTSIAQFGVLSTTLVRTGDAMAIGSARTGLFRNAMYNMTLTARAAGVAVDFLGASLKAIGSFLLTSALPVAAIMAVGYGIQKLTEHISNQRAEEQQLKQQQDNLILSYSKNRDQVKKLADEYDSLSNAKKNGGLDTEQEKEYADVQNKLAKILPTVKAGIDAKGNSIVKSNSAIQDQIALLEKQIKLEKEKQTLDAPKKLADSGSKITDLQDEANKQNKIASSFKEQVKALEEGHVKHSQILYVMGQENEASLKAANAQNQINAQQQKNAELIKGYFSGSKIDTQGITEISAVLSQLSLKGKDMGEVDLMFKSLASTVNKLSSSISKGNKQGIDDATKSLKSLGLTGKQVKEIISFLSDEQNKGAISAKNHKQALQEEILTTDQLDKKLQDAKGSFTDTRDAIMEMVKAKEYDKAITASQGQAYSALVDEITPLNTVLESLAKGRSISAAEAMDLISKEKDLAGAISIENGIVKINQQAVEKLRDAKVASFQEMINAEKAEIAAQSKGLATKLKNYGLEIQAILSVAQANDALAEAEKKHADQVNNINKSNSVGSMHASVVETSQYDGVVSGINKIKDAYSSLDRIAGLASTGLKQVGTEAEKTSNDSVYVSDKFKQALDKVNLELEKQKKLQDQYPKTSKQYQDSLKAEVSLLDQKKKLLQDQSKSLASQISSGKIQQTGKVNSTSTSSYTSGGSTSNQIWNFFKSMGLSDSAVAGIMGNLQLESGLSTTATNKSSGAYGLAQWLGGRKTALNNYAKSKGTSSSDLQTQLEYLWKELNGSESKTLNYLQSNPNASASTMAQMFDKLFERSEGTSVASRQKYANQIMSQYAGKGVTGTSADNAQAIDEAKSQLLQLQQDIMDIDNQIQELNLTMVQSVAAEQDRKVNSYRDDMAKLDAQQSKVDQLSQSWRDLEAERLRELNKQKEYSQQAIDYLNEQYRINDKLTSAQKATIAEDVLDRTKALYELQQTINETEQKIAQSKFDEFLKGVKNAYDDASTRLDDINKKMDMAATESERAKYLKTEIALMKERQRLAVDNILKLKQERVEMSAFPDIVSSIDEEIKTWTDNSKQITVDLNNAYSQLADNIVSIYKDMYSQEKDMALKNIDDELNAYKKATDERLKQIDKQENDNSYSKDLAGKQKELQDIQKQIDKLRLDDSLGAKAKLADLLKQQADKQLELDEFMHQREVDLQKQAIQDEATAREDAANQQKDQMTKYYDDLINSERNFANMREQIMQGNISSLQVDLQNFATFVQQNMATIGQSISENLLDKLAAAGISLSSISGNGVTFNTPSSTMSNLLQFDTGGYTKNGQGVAMLHEKELILNKDDTSNFLAGIKILRPIVDFLKNPSLPKITPAMPTGSLPPISINIENLSVAGGKQGADDFLNYINNKFAARGLNTRV